MMFLEVSLSNFTKKPLTYRNTSTKSLLGYRVKVPFGQQYKIGIIVGESSETNLNMEIKPIELVLDSFPILTQEHISFLKQIANYYYISFNELILSSLPKAALKEDCITDPLWFKQEDNTFPWHELLSKTRLSTLQKQIKEGSLQPISRLEPTVHYKPNLTPLSPAQSALTFESINLLWGQTGSGKTEVYIHKIHEVLQKKQQVLFLVPEIALIGQAAKKIQDRLGIEPTIIHSQVSPKAKLCRWLSLLHGQSGIVLGTRSALLYPIKDLGLIIVDEEHDNAYRQEQSLFFSAKDAAILKANLLHIPIILGSATPSLESYYNALSNKYHLCLLESRYKAVQPKVHMIEKPKDGFISPKLIDIVTKELKKNHHVMLYIGKRGYSRLVKCHHCGYELRCQSCDRLMVFHEDKTTQCHDCGYKNPAIVDCPECKMAELSHYGAGSQRITEIAKELWPDYPIVRIDTDIMNSDEASKVLTDLSSSKATLVVGTQMLTKGHDIDRLNTVIVVDADHGLYAPDFRAEEKLFAELVQVSGRSGRRSVQGHVYIQSQSLGHKVFQHLSKPQDFYQYLLTQRKAYSLPPYTHIACLFVRTNATQAKKLLALSLPEFEHVSIVGPCIFPPGQKKGQSCYQIMVSSSQRTLRNQAFITLYQLLERTLSKNSTLLSQIDSHLSL